MGKYLDLIRSAEKTHEQTGSDTNRPQGQRSIETGVTLVPGARVTWQVDDGTPRGPATVDFLHTDPDGRCWAFCLIVETWAAVNTKFITHIEEGARHGSDEAA